MTPFKFFIIAVSLIALWAIIDSIRANYRRRRYDRQPPQKHDKNTGGIGDAGNTAAGGAMFGAAAPFMFHGQSDPSGENQDIDPGTGNNVDDWGADSSYDSGGYDGGGDGGGGDGGGGD
jgi:hypothetical protein